MNGPGIENGLPRCPTPRCSDVRERSHPMCPKCWKSVSAPARHNFHAELKRMKKLGQKTTSRAYVMAMLECVRDAFKAARARGEHATEVKSP